MELTFNSLFTLIHWGRATHICVGKLTTIGSDNGLSPGRRQAIIWTIAGILLIGPMGTNFSEILIGIQTFSFKQMHVKMSSAKWRPSCLGLNVLTAKSTLCITDSFVSGSPGFQRNNNHVKIIQAVFYVFPELCNNRDQNCDECSKKDSSICGQCAKGFFLKKKDGMCGGLYFGWSFYFCFWRNVACYFDVIVHHSICTF